MVALRRGTTRTVRVKVSGSTILGQVGSGVKSLDPIPSLVRVNVTITRRCSIPISNPR